MLLPLSCFPLETLRSVIYLHCHGSHELHWNQLSLNKILEPHQRQFFTLCFVGLLHNLIRSNTPVVCRCREQIPKPFPDLFWVYVIKQWKGLSSAIPKVFWCRKLRIIWRLWTLFVAMRHSQCGVTLLQNWYASVCPDCTLVSVFVISLFVFCSSNVWWYLC